MPRHIVPPSFLFRYSIPVAHRPSLPRTKPPLLKLPRPCRLPAPGSLDGFKTFAELRAGWNAAGLGISVEVRGKKRAPVRSTEDFLASDQVQLWIDTRNTQSIHHASRYCHRFVLFPTGAGARGEESEIIQSDVARAREDAPRAEPGSYRVWSEALKDGYRLEAWFGSEALFGYDPEANPALGFFYRVHDTELGDQFLTADSNFPVETDPSVWSTLELTAGT